MIKVHIYAGVRKSGEIIDQVLEMDPAELPRIGESISSSVFNTEIIFGVVESVRRNYVHGVLQDVLITLK